MTGLVTRAVVSAINVGRSVAGQDETLATDAPIVAVLSTDRDDPANWLETGRALEHVVLTAANHGAIAGYLNQPCQVAELRPQLAQLLPAPRHPQVVFRLGRPANTPAASPRRAIDDVIVHDERA
jgi:hypothetical protein